jgi:hypothetical protein
MFYSYGYRDGASGPSQKHKDAVHVLGFEIKFYMGIHPASKRQVRTLDIERGCVPLTGGFIYESRLH